MKKIAVMLLFFSLNSFAQNSFFIDKKGEKTIIKDDEWDIIVIDKRVSYKLPGKTWEKYITFSDLDYGIFGSYKFKSFKINKKKKAYFVQAEADGKSLISLAVTTVATSGGISSSNTHYEVLVVDSEDNVLEKLDFHDFRNSKSVSARGQLAGMVKSHFPNCRLLLEALDNANMHDKLNMEILSFLNTPIFRDCE